MFHTFLKNLANNVIVTEKWMDMTQVERDSCLVIGTHDGKFHADEVMATGILAACALSPSSSSSSSPSSSPSSQKTRHAVLQKSRCVVVRTRNPAILQKCDVVFDVGHMKQLMQWTTDFVWQANKPPR